MAVVLTPLFLVPGAANAADPPAVTRYDQTDEHIDYVGTWDTFERTAAYKTAYARANTRGASVTIYFNGTSLSWIAMKGSSTGKADVYLDDVFQKTINLSASSAVYQVAVWSTGELPSGRHKVTISRSTSTPAGTFVTLDAVDVAGTLAYGPPAITGLSPVSGSTAGGASVTISGTDFTDASAVAFGNADAASFTVESSTMITAVAPLHSAGTVSVKVTTPSGSTADTSADDYQYADVTVPTITGISPATGASGDSVVITGTGFIGLAGPDAVTFGGVSAAGYTVDSLTQITAVAPSHDSAKVRVEVKAAGGTTADTPADDFTYVTRYDQSDSRFSYAGTWAAYSTTSAWKGSYDRMNTSGGSVTLTFTGTRLSWIATKGTTTGQADVYVDGAFDATVDLAAPAASYRQEVWSTGDLSNAVHTVKIVRSAASLSGKYITIDAVDVVGTLLGGGRTEQTDAHLAYAGTWSVVSATGASGGSYRRVSGSGAAVYVDFTGIELAWIATTGSGMGKAWVSVDGGTAQSVDLAAGTTAYKQKVWDSGPLALGDHEVKIWWDADNASSKYISADAFDVLGSLRQAYLWHRYEQTDVRLLSTGSWSIVAVSGASGGSYKQTSSTSAFFDFVFSGRQFEWIATTGPAMGKAQVSIDGGAPVTVDLFGATSLDQQKVWTSPALPDGDHRVQIWVSETSAPGAYIDVDAVDVHGSLPSLSSASAAKTMWAEQRLKELSYLPGVVNGVFDTKTRGAVVAFEKWEGLPRDGVIGTAVWARLHTATRPKPTRIGTTDPWIEVNKTKQVLLFCKDGAVLYTIPVSTGSASVGMITPSGTFSIISKTPPRDHLYYPMAITSGIAIHGYPTVPTTAASHGCVRTQNWDQDVLYPITPMRTRVYIY
jgi:L,D-transpeptidase catalytic domain/IPT/TIG domain/Putative peptidoglycan binding domain